MEVSDHTVDKGYHMGVYLCLGQPSFGLSHFHSIPISDFTSYSDIHQYMSEHGKIFIFLAEGIHKIKKKAEQIACESVLENNSKYVNDYQKKFGSGIESRNKAIKLLIKDLQEKYYKGI
jgi:hypothetical protein